MPLRLQRLLSPDEQQRLLTELDVAEFVDGKRSAGPGASHAKNNRELLPGRSEHSQRVNAILGPAFRRHSFFNAWAMPRAMTPFIVNRFDEGMSYGNHVDNGLHDMGDGRFLRSDLAITLFLSDPASYDGGELVIDADREVNVVKLPAGDAVVYAAGSLHRVEPVRRGTRLAAIGWVESVVRDDTRRSLLFDLYLAIDQLLRAPDHPERRTLQDTLEKVRSNLVRMWSET